MNPYSNPDAKGHYGRFGGRYVPESLIPALLELEDVYAKTRSNPEFLRELEDLLQHYVGRPTPLYLAKRLSQALGFSLWLKREDLNHTGAHKINNTVGQILLARVMGKKRIIAETGAGQHGVATATVCARFGLDCHVYMGEEDMDRQRLNVFRMELLGAKVIPAMGGTRTLKDATNEAIRDWVANVETSYYLLGSVVGPHPYPMMVRDFQSVIGKETKEQFATLANQPFPNCLVACVGGGSNAMGLFYPFVDDPVEMVGVEAAGEGLTTSRHAATLTLGRPGVLHGSASYLLQDEHGQISLPHSISAGLDYPGVGPEHSHFKDIKRVDYHAVTDQQAMDACQTLCQTEGILPALESSHALAWVLASKGRFQSNDHVVLCLSGRGDKDVHTISSYLQMKEKA